MPAEVRGSSLLPLLAHDAPQRDIGIFGMFGGPIGATDGRYTYYLYPEDLYAPGLYEYTLMPMHLHTLFSGAEMRTAKLAEPFDFTKEHAAAAHRRAQGRAAHSDAGRQEVRPGRRHDLV